MSSKRSRWGSRSPRSLFGSTVVLIVLGVPFAVALGLLVAVLDLIPLAGATIAAVIVSTVGFIHSITAGVVLIVFFLVSQQF